MGHKRRAVESAAESVGWPLKSWKWWENSNLFKFQISNGSLIPDQILVELIKNKGTI